jgi:molybdopterin-synthase adenylyltransferase
VTTQGYWAADVGKPKVQATAQAIARLDPQISLELIDDRYRRKMATGEVVFCCVDSIEARSAIWRSLRQSCKFWCDGRMLAETMRVLVAADDDSRAHYATTLYAANQAQTGRCTARSTLFTANIAAGLMVHQFARWLRGHTTDDDVSLNLLAMELVVGCGVG